MNNNCIHIVHAGDIEYFQCSTYLISHEGKALLVDPGLGMVKEAVLAGIAKAGFSVEQLSGGPDFSVEQSLESLERLLEMGVTGAFTGHGVVENGKKWLQEGIALGRQGNWSLEKNGKMYLQVS